MTKNSSYFLYWCVLFPIRSISYSETFCINYEEGNGESTGNNQSGTHEYGQTRMSHIFAIWMATAKELKCTAWKYETNTKVNLYDTWWQYHKYYSKKFAISDELHYMYSIFTGVPQYLSLKHNLLASCWYSGCIPSVYCFLFINHMEI